MPIFLDPVPIPSGTTMSIIQDKALTDLGLSIAASGSNTVTQDTADTLFNKSVDRINRELGLSLQVVSGEFVPTPATAVLDLVVLQMECLTHKRQTELSTTGSGRGVKRVKLEDIEVEFDSVDKAKNLDAKFGYCQEAQDALLKYKLIRGHVDGSDIIWDGNTRRWEEVDHDGTTSLDKHYDHRSDGGQYPGVDPGDFLGGPTGRFGH